MTNQRGWGPLMYFMFVWVYLLVLWPFHLLWKMLTCWRRR